MTKAKAAPERVVQLALSQKAAKLLDAAIEIAKDEQFHFSPEADVMVAIQKDLHDQIEQKPKPKRKKGR